MLDRYNNVQQDRSSNQANKIKARSDGDWDSRILGAEPNPDLITNPHYWGAYCRGMYQRYLEKYNIEPKKKPAPVSLPLSKKRKRYAIEYQNKRIGIIEPGIDHWCAIADLQYGAAQNKLDSPMLAVNWLVDNYKRVSEAGIIFFASQNLMHYNIECEDWLIKIDLTPYDCLAKINHENNLDFEYFPDLNSAVVFSFDLILNQDRSSSNNYNSEF